VATNNVALCSEKNRKTNVLTITQKIGKTERGVNQNVYRKNMPLE